MNVRIAIGVGHEASHITITCMIIIFFSKTAKPSDLSLNILVGKTDISRKAKRIDPLIKYPGPEGLLFLAR